MKPPVIRSSLLRQPVLYSRSGRHLLRERSDQNGFALIAVLAVIAITSVTIGALLGMMLTAIKITENQERDARQARAADGAVTAAINQLRLNQDPAKDACTPGVPSIADGGLPLTFESSGRTDEATVTCRTAADELGESAGNIELSGTKREWTSFRDSLDGPSNLKTLINGAETNLVHWGNSALKFNGNLSSDGGAVPIRYDPEGTPALDVRGTYDQAAKGIGAAAGSAASCGELSGAAAVAATTVRASGGARCGDPLLVPVSATQEPDIDELIPTSPDLSAGCPDETVIEFDPGKYDQDAVAMLNKWFGRGVGSCTNKTFYFPDGRYWFDANTVINGVGALNQHALIFDNPSSTFVFGKANGWDPAVAGPTAANFPKACDPSLSGASIILSGRTEFRHLAGRLAVCPYRSGAGATPDPALAQQPTVPTQITGTSGASALFTCDVEPGKDTCEASRTFPVTTLDSRMSEDISSAWLNVTGDETGQNVSLVTTRTASLSVVLPGGAKCDVPATTGAPDNNGVATYDLLATAGNCGGIITSGEQLDGAQVVMEYSYTYYLPCLKYIGAKKCPILPGKAQSLTIQNMEVIANPWEGSAASVGASPTGGWSDPSDAQKDDSKSATLRTPCNRNICTFESEQSFTRELTMADFKNSGDEETGEGDSFPDPHVESLGVLIKQALPNPPLPPPNSFNLASTLIGETTLTLTLSDAVNPADQTVCPKSFSGVINQAGAHYFPLISQSEDPCGGRLLLAAQRSPTALVSLSVSFRLDCIDRVYVFNSFYCKYLQPVPIQYVGLVATSDSYSKVTKSQLTIDSASAIPAGGAPGGPASANFFGSAYLKNVALDLNWNGKASGASLFGGELQLNSLGSLMKATATADVVCCTAPETNIRKVRLTAFVDGEAKLSAVVALNSKEETPPAVLEWTVCGRNGNCSP